MKTYLFTSWYTNKQRENEMEACLQVNLNNPHIDLVCLLSDDGSLPKKDHPKLIPFFVKRRPRFSDFFDLINDYEEAVVAVANSDIYFDETIRLCHERLGENDCYALTRWDIQENKEIIFYNHIDSQDAWIFRGEIKPGFYDFEMGRLGCDNRLACELKKAGYNVTNPSKSIKANHLHLEKRTLNGNHDKTKTIPPPYEYVLPTALPPFLSIVTRHHPRRPKMFELNTISVSSQKDKDFEHVILYDFIGIGSAKANQMFFQNKESVLGDYVFMLDDDDIFISDEFVGDIKKIVKENNRPGIIFVRMLINDSLLPTTNLVWGKDILYKHHIGTSCFVMRNDLWQDNIHLFSATQIGDFDFINCVFEKKPTVFWQDKIYSKTLRVSRGSDE